MPRRSTELTRTLFPLAAVLVAGMWLGVYLSGRPLAPASEAALIQPAPPPDGPDTTPAPPPLVCNPDLAMAHVLTLAEEIGCRPAGSPQEAQAARYISGYLLGLGYDIINKGEIPLSDEQRVTHNVIARRDTGDGAGLLIGAHYDSIALRERSPGGNDNASGVAAMLEMARLCAGADAPCPMYFVAFGGEEMIDGDPDHHHFGSRHFYAHQPEPLAAMISVDMIGVGDRLYLRYLEPAPEPLLQALEAAAQRTGIALARKADPGHSDHEPFARGGIPAVWIQRLDDPAYHSVDDVADHVEPVYLQTVVRLLMDMLGELDRQALDEMAAWSTGWSRTLESEVR